MAEAKLTICIDGLLREGEKKKEKRDRKKFDEANVGKNQVQHTRGLVME
jgi:hypothetical protein